MTQQTQQGGVGPSGRPGQMTAVMRAVAATGPKVLRIGVVQGGRVIEERIIKNRTSVTVGPSEKSMFVIAAGSVPGIFKLFELVGNDYHLNFLDNMTGRLALPTGISDLNQLKGQARRSPQGAYQIRLTEDSRGKVVLGDTTFLFQFVAPPPIQPKPQLPVSVTRGATSIDWATTMIAAVSFLVHFMAIGTVYSDWMDHEVNFDLDMNSLVEQVRSLPAPPEIETPDAEATDEGEEEEVKEEVKPKAKPQEAAGDTPKMSAAQAAALSNELASLEMATLGALTASGPAVANVLGDGNVPTSALDEAARSGAAVSEGGPGGLKLGGAGGTIRPGAAGGGLASIGSKGKSGGEGSGQAKAVKGPKGNASVGGASVAGGSVSNASSVVARMRAGFRACYNRGLASNPDAQGKIMLSIKVGPSGNVTGVSASQSGSLPGSVVGCVKARARAARFSPPEGGAAVVQVPVSFVKQ